ncbi:MAG: FAD binding domain-containing protein, partial [Thermoanaerobaculia bacterium]|nr:FAD binding domain-containing protein [Thermoanaerobaculia bacterium]
EIASDSTIRELYPVLAQAASEVGSPQLRHQGTLGGNLCQKPRCWYYRGDFHCLRKGGSTCFALDGANAFHCIFAGDLCYIVHPSDTAPALVALEARVRIVGPGGSRWLPVEQLHVPPSEDPRRETVLASDEILTEVRVPAPKSGLRSSYRKVRARRAWDFALAGVALALGFDGQTVRHARVVLSGAAPVPWRSRPVEELLVGRSLDQETVNLAREAVVEGAEPLEHNGYKIPLFRAVLGQELSALGETV